MRDGTDRRREEGSAPAAADHPRLVLVATILASSLSFVDSSVVNVGLRSIGGTLGGDAAGLQWVIDAYLLPLSAFVLLGGALGDRLGRRRLVTAGLVLFALASAACAAAPGLGFLVAGRVVQGIGAALLMPNSLAMLSDTFQGAARGRAIGTWAAVGAAISGLGPVVGGWLIDAVGWRAIFVVNLPLAAVAILLMGFAVPARRGTRGMPLDAVGSLLAALGLGALTFGLIEGSGPAGWAARAGAVTVGGVAALACFAAWERRQGSRALMPLALFGSRSFVGLTLLTVLLYGALGALVVLVPYGLMEAGGASAAASGAALLPLPIALATLSPSMGRLAGRYGARPLLTAGSAVVGVGFLLFLRVDARSGDLAAPLGALAVIGLGLAAAVAPLTTAVLNAVETPLAGTASGFNSAVARTGGLVATACLGRVLAADGEAFVAACHAAALVAAGACFGAAVCASLLVTDWPRR